MSFMDRQICEVVISYILQWTHCPGLKKVYDPPSTVTSESGRRSLRFLLGWVAQEEENAFNELCKSM